MSTEKTSTGALTKLDFTQNPGKVMDDITFARLCAFSSGVGEGIHEAVV